MTNKTVKELMEALYKAEAYIRCGNRSSLHADAVQEAATTLTQQAAEIEALREALQPFGCDDFEHPVADENGWTDFGISWCRERIVDWFGPSQFRKARTALTVGGQTDG